METRTTESPVEVETPEAAGWLTPGRCFLLIALLATICFANGLTGDFVQDDFVVVLNNPAVHSLANIPRLFAEPYWGPEGAVQGTYRPLTNLSHALTYAVFGLLPLPYHLGNLALHILDSCLVFLVIRRLTGRLVVAFPAAIVFTVHPVHVEAVSQIVGRTELLSAAFFLLAWWFYLDGPMPSGRRTLSWLCFGAALFSKENTLVFLGVIPLADFCFRGKNFRAVLGGWARESLPYFGILAGYLAIRFLALGRMGVDIDQTVFKQNPVWVRWLTMIDGFTAYFRLLVFPRSLCADYDFSVIHRVTVPEWSTFWGLMLLLTVTGIGIRSLFRNPVIGFGILFFFVSISIVSNVVVSTGIIIAERVLYLPSFGFCLLVGYGFAEFLRRKPAFRWAAALVFILICSLMVWRDIRRNRDWADNCTFYRALVRDAPGNPKSWLGVAPCTGSPAERERVLRKAVELAPDRSPTHLALGQFLSAQGRHSEAMTEFRNGYAAYSKSDKICLELAIGTLEEGDEKGAFEWFSRACAAASKKSATMILFAEELTARGRPEKALQLYREALLEDPDNPLIYEGIGLLFLKLNLFSEAEQAAREGVRLNPESDSLHTNLGIALLARGKPDEARKEFILALRLNPRSEVALQNLRMVERRRFGGHEGIS